MTDERYKKIMADLGMPNSRSLLSALQQVANEAGQECAAAEREACAKVCDDAAQGWRDSDAEGSESLAYEDKALESAARAIRMRSNVGAKLETTAAPK